MYKLRNGITSNRGTVDTNVRVQDFSANTEAGYDQGYSCHLRVVFQRDDASTKPAQLPPVRFGIPPLAYHQLCRLLNGVWLVRHLYPTTTRPKDPACNWIPLTANALFHAVGPHMWQIIPPEYFHRQWCCNKLISSWFLKDRNRLLQ